MIQRIQTVYLSIAAFLLLLLFSNPIAEIVVNSDLYLTMVHYKISSANPESFKTLYTWPVTILLSVIVLIEILTIFFFKKRQLQIRLSIYTILLMIGFEGLIYFFAHYTLKNTEGIKFVFLWPALCPVIAIILNFLALKSIQKDEKLVRSYDRIR